jgi:hypothetical protein
MKISQQVLESLKCQLEEHFCKCLYVSGKRRSNEYLDWLNSLFSLRIFCKVPECVKCYVLVPY